MWVSDQVFDTVRFARTVSTWLASGHPCPEMDEPNDLGLGISTNRGQTWTKVPLAGKSTSTDSSPRMESLDEGGHLPSSLNWSRSRELEHVAVRRITVPN